MGMYGRNRYGPTFGPKKKFDLKKVFNFAWLLLLIPPVIVGGSILYQRGNYSELWLAPCEKDPEVVHTLVIDSSDPITDIQQQSINKLIDHFIAASSAGDITNVVLLTHEPRSPIQWLFSRCDPGGISDHSVFVSTPADVESYRQSTFLQPLTRAIVGAQTPTPRPKTPLLEGLFNLSNDSKFRGGIGVTPESVRLMILSDFLQNSAVSAYDGSLFSPLGVEFSRGYLANFANVELYIGLIDRPKHRRIQTHENRRFLNEYISLSSTGEVKFIENIY